MCHCTAGSQGQPPCAIRHSFRESPFKSDRPFETSRGANRPQASSASSSNGASPDHLSTSPSISPEQRPASAADQSGNGVAPLQRTQPVRGVEPLDSIDAFDLWLDAGECAVHASLLPDSLLSYPLHLPAASSSRTVLYYRTLGCLLHFRVKTSLLTGCAQN